MSAERRTGCRNPDRAGELAFRRRPCLQRGGGTRQSSTRRLATTIDRLPLMSEIIFRQRRQYRRLPGNVAPVA